MARRSGSAIQEELYPTPSQSAREELDDARLLDLDAEKESPFLRAQKRVSVRRSPLPKKTATRLLWVALAAVISFLCLVAAAAFYHYGQHSWRFRLNSSDDIEMAGLANVSRAQIMEVMGGDIGRNIFFIPLDQRQKQLEQIPWVASASVMRFAPDRIRIQINERTPVAFARIGAKVMLIDANGVLMDLSTRKKFSFPVLMGMSPAEPISTRAARMQTYNELIRQLDSGGGHYSQDLSEVDLSDPEDVKVLTNDPGGEVLVHLGSSDYLERFKIYVAHLREWRQQFEKVESVDLRYDRQIIVNPDLHGTPNQVRLSPAVARAAIASGVKPSALITREPSRSAPVHIVPIKEPTKKSATKSSAICKATAKSAFAPAKQTKRHPAPQKHPVAIKHAFGKPAASSTAMLVKPKSASRSKKPSPAIAKGQESR